MGEERASGSEGRMTTAEVESYLARIRETVRKSELLMEQAELRCRETDRLLASQGLTREDAEHLLDGVELPEGLRERIEGELAALDSEAEEERRLALSRLKEEEERERESGEAAEPRPPSGGARRFGPLMQPYRL